MQRSRGTLDAAADAFSRLNYSERIWLVFLAGLMLTWLIEALLPSDPQRRAGRTVRGDQSFLLDEDTLRYLEGGRRIRVSRWHGHDLVLAGRKDIDPEDDPRVITVNSTTETDETDDAEDDDA